MDLNLVSVISDNWVVLAFVVIGFGLLLAKITIGGIALGSTAGVLIAGLLFGHFGFPDAPNAATFGFTIFIFSVGLQAGPSFFSMFAQDGPRCIALAIVVAATGFFAASAMVQLLDLDYGFGAGLLAGALTSTPTLAGAQDALNSSLSDFPAGMDATTAAGNIGVAYAITYIFGTIGLIVVIRFLPRILGLDLPAEARKLAKERGLEPTEIEPTSQSIPIIRAYGVRDDGGVVGKTVEQVMREQESGLKILRIRRREQVMEADPGHVFEPGDVVAVLGSLADQAELQQHLGREVMDPQLLNYQMVTREIIVTSKKAAGVVLDWRKLVMQYSCLPVAVHRAGIQIPAEDGLVVQMGDRITVSGEEGAVKRLAAEGGYIEDEVEDTDLITFSGGIIIGSVIGVIMIHVGEISIGLGSAGGLLLMGILIGYLRSLHPTFGRLPAGARWLLKEFGLLLFMASVGLGAGSGIVEGVMDVGIELFFAGVVVTLVPVFVAYAFGRAVLKMNPVLLLGAVTGAMTSTPSLGAVSEAAKSPVPALGYAGTYTFANVFLTFAGSLLMVL